MWIGRCQLAAAAVRAVHAKKGALVFADCGLVVDPDTAELADIAVTSAESFEALMDATRGAGASFRW